MGFFSKVGNFWAQNIAPISLTAAGAAFGGPVGAAVGAGVGQKISGYYQNKEMEKKQREADERNYNAQKEFASNGLRWKVEDAKRAGINPLVALGAPTSSFQSSFGASPTVSGPDLGSMGQDIARSIHSTRTQEERDFSSLQLQSARLDLEGKALDNAIKNSQLTKMSQVGPAFPGSQNFISGQGNSGSGIQEKPLTRTMSLPGSPHSEPGAIPDVGWTITGNGALVPVPSTDVKERIEDNMPQEWSHYIRNNIAPNWGGGPKPPKSALPKGYDRWAWSLKHQGYVPEKNKKRSEINWDFPGGKSYKGR